MTNLMQDAATWLGDRLQEQAGRTITYKRGTTTIATTGALREQVYKGTNAKGLYTQTKSYDWLVPAADMTITPRRGDTITEAGAVYEVLPVSEMPCFEYHDNAGFTMIVHTKKVSG